MRSLVLEGLPGGGLDALYSPRRTVLDAILVDAAREAGAEVREGFIVDGLVPRTARDGVSAGAKGGAPVDRAARAS